MTGLDLRRTLIPVLLIAMAGCSRAVLDPGDSEGPPSPVVRAPAADDRIGGGPVHTRVLDHPPVEVDEVDPIMFSLVRDDPYLSSRIDYWVEFWTTRGAEHFGRYLERMARYHGVVDRELGERGLPPSLRFLPVVESGYHHGAVSRVGATGLWQIMSPTARDLGLSISAHVDDRRDPLLSTRAALDYLHQLHRTFDSWFLALAAYNAGPGRVAGVIRQHAPESGLSGDELFLKIRPHLPAETREFVPRFFAAAMLAGDPERYGFDLPVGVELFAFDEVEVPDATSFDVLARAAGVEEAEIRSLNPHYLRGFTPVGQARVVRVPPGSGATFEANYALIPPEERISFLEHAVAQGETLTHIARRYSIPVADLRAANGNVDPRRLQIGRRLVVPVAGVRTAGAIAGAQGPGADDVISDGDGSRVHLVRSGDTWGGIAERYGVRSAELARTNGRTTSDVIRIGEELRIP